jgi:hypothetical protein
VERWMIKFEPNPKEIKLRNGFKNDDLLLEISKEISRTVPYSFDQVQWLLDWCGSIDYVLFLCDFAIKMSLDSLYALPTYIVERNTEYT